jgi:hypothetical protein
MTSDEILQHWRDVLTVAHDEEPVTRTWCLALADVVVQGLTPMATRLGTPLPTPRELQEKADAERGLADAEMRLAAYEAAGVELPPLPPDTPELQALQAEERRRDELEARVQRGELIEKAALIAEIDRALGAALQRVRSEARKVRHHLSGDWSQEQIEAWWAPVAEAACAELDAVFQRLRK